MVSQLVRQTFVLLYRQRHPYLKRDLDKHANNYQEYSATVRHHNLLKASFDWLRENYTPGTRTSGSQFHVVRF